MENAAVCAGVIADRRSSDPDTLDSAGVVCGPGGTGLNCQVDGTTRSASSAEAEKAAVAFRWLRNVSRMSSVERVAEPQPNDLRGRPVRNASCRKSESFDTMTKPCSAAYSQISTSVAVLRDQRR